MQTVEKWHANARFKISSSYQHLTGENEAEVASTTDGAK